jgi:NADPH:quinone reductase-like Zn-dependent oxidoreductase
MRAAWYEKQGPAREVLQVSEMPDPTPSAGEVRIRIAVSGINPGDTKKRGDAFGVGMAYPRVIPHSDGAGRIDQIGPGVSAEWIGRNVCAMERSRIAPSAQRRNLRSYLSITLHRCPPRFRWSRARASGFRASRRITRFILAATFAAARFWCKAAESF